MFLFNGVHCFPFVNPLGHRWIQKHPPVNRMPAAARPDSAASRPDSSVFRWRHLFWRGGSRQLRNRCSKYKYPPARATDVSAAAAVDDDLPGFKDTQLIAEALLLFMSSLCKNYDHKHAGCSEGSVVINQPQISLLSPEAPQSKSPRDHSFRITFRSSEQPSPYLCNG